MFWLAKCKIPYIFWHHVLLKHRQIDSCFFVKRVSFKATVIITKEVWSFSRDAWCFCGGFKVVLLIVKLCFFATWWWGVLLMVANGEPTEQWCFVHLQDLWRDQKEPQIYQGWCQIQMAPKWPYHFLDCHGTWLSCKDHGKKTFQIDVWSFHKMGRSSVISVIIWILGVQRPCMVF